MFLQLVLCCLHSTTALIFFNEKATVSLLIVFYRRICWFLNKENDDESVLIFSVCPYLLFINFAKMGRGENN